MNRTKGRFFLGLRSWHEKLKTFWAEKLNTFWAKKLKTFWAEKLNTLGLNTATRFCWKKRKRNRGAEGKEKKTLKQKKDRAKTERHRLNWED